MKHPRLSHVTPIRTIASATHCNTHCNTRVSHVTLLHTIASATHCSTLQYTQQHTATNDRMASILLLLYKMAKTHRMPYFCDAYIKIFIYYV